MIRTESASKSTLIERIAEIMEIDKTDMLLTLVNQDGIQHYGFGSEKRRPDMVLAWYRCGVCNVWVQFRRNNSMDRIYSISCHADTFSDPVTSGHQGNGFYIAVGRFWSWDRLKQYIVSEIALHYKHWDET